MASLYNVPEKYHYRFQREYFQTYEDQMMALSNTCTLYVGGMAFFTCESAIYEFFSRVAVVKKVIMGINRFTKQPCGFCFVEYLSHDAAELAMRTLTGSRLDEHLLTIELDWGFSDGRQYGKGSNGGQVRDNIRKRPQDSGRDTRIFRMNERPKRRRYQDGGVEQNLY